MQQLLNFQHYEENENSKYTHSTKRQIKQNSGKIFGKNDDAAIAFQMGIYWANQLYYNPNYATQVDGLFFD